MEKFDFGGWATKANLKCSDGRTIMKDAFKDNDGKQVPLVWNHQHNDPNNILGHAVLENRNEGVYAHCKFNDSESGRTAKLLVEHGDVSALSIYANQLKENMNNVLHGNIREVSLVLAGANPGASIDSIIRHGEETEEEAIIYTGEDIMLTHSDEGSEEDTSLSHAEKKDDKTIEEKKKDDKLADEKNSNEKTVADIFNEMTEEQKTVVYALIGQALEDYENDKNDEEGDKEMKHNVFDNENEKREKVLTHSDMETIIADGKRYGSLKESFLAHAQEYGIENIDYLFPDEQNVDKTPQFIKRDAGWVGKVMGAVHHTPFSRIKSVFADVTEDEARAKGYIKGKLKKEEVFSLLKRTTTPTTIYKKQKIDRDDVVDITDFDVVAWLKSEMRMMLDEEIARAILVGDGRLASSDDKINEQNIRPVWTDEDLFTIKRNIAQDKKERETDEDNARIFIRSAIRARKDYEGSGTPTLYTTEDMVTECLLLEDGVGRVLYDTVDKLATALRVKEIVTVPCMKGLVRNYTTSEGAKTAQLLGIIVNLTDYNVGADKGGAVNMFDDFDIDYNAQKYLIETRCSGAMVKPHSAIVLEQEMGN